MEQKQEYIEPSDVYPFYEGAIQKILDRFEIEGYGVEIKHADLKSWMGIEPADNIEAVKKEQLDYLTGMDKVRNTLLLDYNLCIHPMPGDGYKILTPEEQIKKGADRHFRKSQKALVNAALTLTNVDHSELNIENRQLQLTKIGRVAFIKAAFRKRNVPALKEQRQIG